MKAKQALTNTFCQETITSVIKKCEWRETVNKLEMSSAKLSRKVGSPKVVLK